MGLDQAEVDDWYRGKEFAYDWTSQNLEQWAAVLAPLRDRPSRLLEIGSYEGRSAVFFLSFLPRASLVCIDAWDPEVLEPELVRQMPEFASDYLLAEGRFDGNTAAFGDRVTKIKGRSGDVLAELGVGGDRFDMIYVDGDHRRMAAYRDCVLSWPLLVSGGILILDDYRWGVQLADDLKPKQGIDAFLGTIDGQFEELERGHQIIGRKR